MKSTRCIISLFFLLSTIGGLAAQTEQTCQIFWGNLANNTPTVSVQVPIVHNSEYSQMNYKVNSGRFYVKLDFGDIFPYGTTDEWGDLLVNLSIVGSRRPNATGQWSQDQSISLTQQVVLTLGEPEKILFVNFTPVSIQEEVRFDVTTTRVISGLTPNAPSNLTSNLRGAYCYSIDYGVDAQSQSISATNMSGYQITGSKKAQFSWSSSLFPKYQLQVMRLMNTSGIVPLNEYQLTTSLDWDKALLFETGGNCSSNGGKSIELTLAEGTGYYAWRLRPIGTFYENGSGNSQNFGTWTPVNNGSVNISLPQNATSANPVGVLPQGILYFKDVDDNINSIYSRTFTDNGQVHESLVYANGLLQGKQSQSFVASNKFKKNIISHNLYDHAGRPSISFLPAPTDLSFGGYKEGLIQVNDGGRVRNYNAKDIDHIEPNTINPNAPSGKNIPKPVAEIPNVINLHDYYTDRNTNELNVPVSNDYPFSKTVFSNDGLGRVVEQSGPGKAHSLGEQADGKGRTTRTEYLNATEDELLRVFGEEAPNAQKVLKTVVTDPNNTQSITYSTSDGKTIATCLNLSDDASLLESVKRTNGQDDNPFGVEHILDEGILTNGRFENTTRNYFKVNQILQINYEPSNCQGRTFCGELIKCSYDLKIELYNVQNLNVNLLENSPGYSVSLNFDSPGFTPPSFAPITIPSSGTYIVKKIIIPKDYSDRIVDKLAEYRRNLKPYVDLMGLLLTKVVTDRQYSKFMEVVAELNVYSSNSPQSYLPNQLKNYINDGTSNARFPGFVNSPTISTVSEEYNFDLSTLSQTNAVSLEILEPGATAANGTVLNPTARRLIKIRYATSSTDDCPVEFNVASDYEDPLIGIFDYYDPNRGYIRRGTFGEDAFPYPPFVEYLADKGLARSLDDNGNLPQGFDFRKFFPGYYEISGSNGNQVDWVINNTNLLAYLNRNTSSNYGIALTSLNNNSFNRMVHHMLRDEYVSDRLKANQTTSTIDKLKSDGSVDGPFDASSKRVQYSEEDLKKCWMGIVQTFEKASESLTNLQTQNAGGNVYSTVSDASDPDASDPDCDPNAPGYNPANCDTQVDAHTDDHRPSNWFIDLFIGNIDPHERMRDVMQNREFVSPYNIPHTFLECAGYRFAAIVNLKRFKTPTNADINPDDISNPASTNASTTRQQLEVQILSYLNTRVSQSFLNSNGNYINFADLPVFSTNASFPLTQLPVEISVYLNQRHHAFLDDKNFTDPIHGGNNSSVIDNEVAYFKFTYNPEYAFKYFEYDDMRDFTSTPIPANDAYLTPDPASISAFFSNTGKPGNHIFIERNHCYEATPMNTPISPCNPIECPHGHDTWTSGKRYQFYKELLNSRYVPYNNGNPSPPLVLPCASEFISATGFNGSSLPMGHSLLALQTFPLVKNCRNTCEERRPEFKQRIIQLLQEKCYKIEGCQGSTDFVSFAEIETMANALVQECQNNCSLTVTFNGQQNCHLTTSDPYPIPYCDIKYGELCELKKMEQVTTWAFELDVPSRCAGQLGVYQLTNPTPAPSPQACENDKMTELKSVYTRPN